jgi:hypothetical protein
MEPTVLEMLRITLFLSPQCSMYYLIRIGHAHAYANGELATWQGSEMAPLQPDTKCKSQAAFPTEEFKSHGWWI